jgi:hypothetical protein
MMYLIKSLGLLFDKITSLRKENKVEFDNALRRISHALNETYLYYSNIESTGPNKNTEAQLARLWAAAAIPIRHFDKNLAMACEHKSEYWANPASFSNSDIMKWSRKTGQAVK